jgi:DNA-binding transcriptional MerR regulator
MKPSTLAERLEVNSDTIRRWANTYQQYLSAGANPARGKTRSFSEDDARVLLLVATLRNSGVDHDDIETRLKEHKADNWMRLPELPSEWGLADETVPLGVAVSKASDLAQIAVLRSELETTRTALIAAESRLEELETELAVATGENENITTELNQTKITVEQLRGQVQALNARIEGFNIAYGFGRDRPAPIGIVIAVTAIVAVIIAVSVIIIGTLI